MSDAVERKVGAKIAALRRAARLTQEALAEKVGLAAVTISRLERGVSVPSLATLARIGKALNSGMPELFDVDRPRSVKDRTIEDLSVRLKQRSPAEVLLVNELVLTVLRVNDSKQKA